VPLFFIWLWMIPVKEQMSGKFQFIGPLPFLRRERRPRRSERKSDLDGLIFVIHAAFIRFFVHRGRKTLRNAEGSVPYRHDQSVQ